VFYNAAMQLDRDLNVAVLRALGPSGRGPRRGWDMLAATGVRGLRLVEETDEFGAFAFSEENPAAFQALERNLHESGAGGLEAHLEDSRRSVAKRDFDYVDLDPFGTPVPFLDAALRALAPEGVLAVTATDMPVLTGVARGICEQRYGARPIHGPQGPEGGLRILVAHVMREASRRSINLAPILAYLHDHYVRVYLRSLSPDNVRGITDRLGDPNSLGEGVPVLAGVGPFGPMWLGPLFDPSLVGRLEVPRSAERPAELEKLLGRFKEESTADRPFYYEPNALASELHHYEPPSHSLLLAGLTELGYAAARSHVRPSAFRTTAPRSAVYSIATNRRARL
jgi:tRNA (guanine26-N2/guanine27-N2)-dimethyltransferase